jgi:hypothetical protein
MHKLPRVLGRIFPDGIIPLPGWKHDPGQMVSLRYSPSQDFRAVRREHDRNYRRERDRNYRRPHVTTGGSVTVTNGVSEDQGTTCTPLIFNRSGVGDVPI